MEFKKFFNRYVMLPCQIVRGGRRLVCRVLAYSEHLGTFFATFAAIRRLRVT